MDRKSWKNFFKMDENWPKICKKKSLKIMENPVKNWLKRLKSAENWSKIAKTFCKICENSSEIWKISLKIIENLVKNQQKR